MFNYSRPTCTWSVKKHFGNSKSAALNVHTHISDALDISTLWSPVNGVKEWVATHLIPVHLIVFSDLFSVRSNAMHYSTHIMYPKQLKLVLYTVDLSLCQLPLFPPMQS